jgi:cellulose biosynthesis protein BcsQ
VIISVINNKGGVGKSTITQNLAHALANKGKKILVIDQDPQSNTTSVLTPPTGANTLYDLYKNDLPISQCVYPTPYEGVDIVPNSNRTDTVEIELYSDVRQSYFLLRDTVREHALANYDITLIDCPPNLGLFVMMALICSDSAIIPIEAGSRYSIDGFKSAYEAIEAASGTVQHNLKFLRAVINKVDLRNSISKSSVEYLRRQFGTKMFETTIPSNTDIQKAEADRKTCIRFAPHSTGAKRFKLLADELLDLIS